MKIGTVSEKQQPSFRGFWNNKTVLKGLEFVSEHGAGFTAGVSFIAASGIRPLVISRTPDIKKENKEYAVTNSIVSGAVKFALSLGAAIPIEKAVKSIEKNPEKFLKPDTIKTFKNNADNLSGSRDYRFAAQTFKLGSGLISAVPKSMITAALLPVLAVKLYGNKGREKDITSKKTNTPAFKGKISNAAAKGIGKILDLKSFQTAAKKLSPHDADIARTMSIAQDILLTASFTYGISKNKKMEKERKKPLILNNIYGTAASVLCGSALDEAVKKRTAGFIEKFKELNKNDPKLPKYIEGINIIRPVLIFAAVYYCLLPPVTAYLADKTGSASKK